MTSPAVLDVDTKAFYDAAVQCYEVSDDLHDAFVSAVSQLNECGRMAGSYGGGLAWAQSYDERTGVIFTAVNEAIAALYNYGSVLIDLGHNHDLAEYNANTDPGIAPIRPPDPPAKPPAAIESPSSAGGPGTGLIDDVFGLVEAIGIPVPDGDTQKLAHAGETWEHLSTGTDSADNLARIDRIADRFADVESPEVGYVFEDLLAIRSGVGEIFAACAEVGESCREHQKALDELRDQLIGMVEDLATELAITAVVSIAAAFFSVGASAAIGGAKAVETVGRFAGLMRNAIESWQRIKRLAAGVKAKRDLARVRTVMQRIRELGGKAVEPVPHAGKPGSWKEEFDALSAGKQTMFREVASEQELRAVFERMVQEATRRPARGPGIPDVYELPDGTTVQWRLDSRSGGPTIDIFDGTPGGLKVHLK